MNRSKLLLASVLLLWAALALGLQVEDWRNRREFIARPKAPAETWRLGNLGAARLERCLRAVGQRVPPTDVVAFSAPGRDDEAYLFAWAVFLLPERRLVLRADTVAGDDVDFVLSFGRTLSEAALHPVLDTTCGTLYRVAPPPMGGAS